MSASASSSLASHSFAFRPADFARVQRLIHARAGIALGDHKHEMVYSRLSRRLRAQGIDDFRTYLDALERDGNHLEWQEFVNALTTNLTAFFREPHHFPLLAEFVRTRTEPVSVWCCAASTGEEPYSIAMTLIETLGARAQASLLATDIDTKVLQQTQTGVYSEERLAEVSAERRRRFFLKGAGAHVGKVRVKPELAAMVRLAPLNLLAPDWELPGKFDAIFCRNVMIYFDKPTQARILARFAPLLKPGGLLFAGHSENFTHITRAFRLRGQTVYELVNEGGEHG